LSFQKQASRGPAADGRTDARVICDGTDSSAEQVRAGMAWVFDRYVTDRSLYVVQDEAPPAAFVLLPG
jgi:endonuclease YncB( thermonuclease family)